MVLPCETCTTLNEAIREFDYWGLLVQITLEPNHIVKGDGVHEFAELREDHHCFPSVSVSVRQHPGRVVEAKPLLTSTMKFPFPYGLPTAERLARFLEFILQQVQPNGVKPDLTPRMRWVGE